MTRGGLLAVGAGLALFVAPSDAAADLVASHHCQIAASVHEHEAFAIGGHFHGLPFTPPQWFGTGTAPESFRGPRVDRNRTKHPIPTVGTAHTPSNAGIPSSTQEDGKSPSHGSPPIDVSGPGSGLHSAPTAYPDVVQHFTSLANDVLSLGQTPAPTPTQSGADGPAVFDFHHHDGAHAGGALHPTTTVTPGGTTPVGIATVPEPATAGLFGAGLLGLAAVRAKKKGARPGRTATG